tara:strand:- start:63 stop:2102 length:2040 start_codon:yes stop_codon:yes gene_type:complete
MKNKFSNKNLTDLNFLMDFLRKQSINDILSEFNTNDMRDNKLLKTFHNFFSSNSYLMKSNNQEADRVLFQLAYEHGEGSPLTQQAENLEKDNQIDWPWLRLKNRKKFSNLDPKFITFSEHTKKIIGIHKLSDDNYLSFSEDNTIRLLDLNNRNTKILSNSGVIKFVRLSNNKKLLISAFNDNSLRLWNLKDGSSKVFEGHTEEVRGIHFLKNNKALSWSEDNTLRLWNLEDGSSKLFEGHTERIQDVYLLEDNRALSLSWDRTIRIWDLKKESSIVLKGHDSYIIGIQIHNNIAISWDETRNLKLWNLCNGNLELSKGHKSDIYGVKFINNNTFFAWGDTDTSLHIWNINDKTFKTLNIEQAGYLENIHFTDKYFILHTDLSEINIYDYKLNVIQKIHHDEYIHGIRLLKDYKVLSFSNDKKIKFWDVFNKKHQTLNEHQEIPNDAFQLNENQIVSYQSDGICLWNLEDNSSKLFRDTRIFKEVRKINTNKVVSVSENHEISFWDFSLLDTSNFTENKDSIYNIGMVNYDNIIALDEKNILFQDNDTYELIYYNLIENKKSSLGNIDDVLSMNKLSSDIVIIITDSTDFVVFDNITKKIKTITGHIRPVKDFLLIDEDSFFTWADGTIKLWSIHTMRCLMTYTGNSIDRIIPLGKKTFLTIDMYGNYKELELENTSEIK